MIQFDSFMQAEGVPIYQQIIRYLEQGIAAGTIRDGDGLPSRRVLSAQLGVNPNTVQKACRMLEEERILVSHTGAKSFVTYTPGKRDELRVELLAAGAKASVLALKRLGITLEEAVALIGRAWEEDENK